MSPRLLALAFAPLFAAATAHAQAPGGDYSGDYYAGPSATPPQTLVQPAPPPAVFDSRWSIAASVGSMSVTPDHNPDGKTDFTVGELALRYRGWRHLELELSLAGGNQQLPDGAGEGDLKIAHVTFAARYRFNVQDHWNWWILAGLGATTIAPKDASSDEADRAQHPHALLGLGLEYRWTKFALQAEAKALAIGPTDDEQMKADASGTEAPSAGGGMFTLGGAFYF